LSDSKVTSTTEQIRDLELVHWVDDESSMQGSALKDGLRVREMATAQTFALETVKQGPCQALRSEHLGPLFEGKIMSAVRGLAEAFQGRRKLPLLTQCERSVGYRNRLK
jgi:hypothetical protein